MKQHLFLYFFIGSLFSYNINDADHFESIQDYDSEFQSIQKLISYTDKDVEVTWRMARAYFNQAEKEYDVGKKNKLFYEGYEYSKKALTLDSKSAKANHYYAVFHGKIGLIEGTKQKIINSYDVLKHGEIAIEIDSTYDGTYHLLGRLNFELANLSWLERNFASLIYETPPTGTFKEARNYFKEAIKLNPDDIRHWLWLGKTYLKLDDKNKARRTLSKLIKIEPKDNQDFNNIKEARTILKNLN